MIYGSLRSQNKSLLVSTLRQSARQLYFQGFPTIAITILEFCFSYLDSTSNLYFLSLRGWYYYRTGEKKSDLELRALPSPFETSEFSIKRDIFEFLSDL